MHKRVIYFEAGIKRLSNLYVKSNLLLCDNVALQKHGMIQFNEWGDTGRQ
ncbi:hypothetical protein LguiB_020506 [Lonicera macranthoides]